MMQALHCILTCRTLLQVFRKRWQALLAAGDTGIYPSQYSKQHGGSKWRIPLEPSSTTGTSY